VSETAILRPFSSHCRSACAHNRRKGGPSCEGVPTA